MRKNLVTFYSIFTVLILIDVLSKSWILKTREAYTWGWLKLMYRENYGIIMGHLSQVPNLIKVVFLSTFGMIEIAVFVYLISFYPFKTRRFQLGLVFFFSGISGNIFDRIRYGNVIDFISIELPYLSLPILNLADLFQILGCLLILSAWTMEINKLLPVYSTRESSKVHIEFKKNLILNLLFLFTGQGLITFIFSYVFLKISIEDWGIAARIDTEGYLFSYILMFIFFQLLTSLLIYLLAKIIAHRIYGPIYAIEKYINDTLMKKQYPLKFRADDNFKGLEEKLTQLNTEFIQSNHEK